MAETGNPEKLLDEIREKTLEGTILDVKTGDLIFTPSTTSVILNLDIRHSIVSVVSMIAPSPDWFIGAKINLYQNGSWIEDVAIDTINYDAGTDSGKNFKSPVLTSSIVPSNVFSLISSSSFSGFPVSAISLIPSLALVSISYTGSSIVL